MTLTPRLKIGLAAFILFDIALAVFLFSLYQARTELESAQALRDLGVTLYPESREITAFRLLDQTGEDFTESDFVGQWNLVFFGFTSCPDICPLTMGELKQFYERLDPETRNAVRVIMVSVDPDRDDVAAMGSYVGSFNQDFVGLTGGYAVIANLAAQFFVAHSQPQSNSHDEHAGALQQDYMIEHSGHLALIDPSGRFYGVIRSPVRDQDLTDALQLLASNKVR